MTHIRKQVRDAFVAQLLNQTVAQDRCLAARPVPNPEKNLPALFVWVRRETSSRDGTCLPLERRLDVRIVGFVQGRSDTVDDLADALALEVEKAIVADETLGGTVHELTLVQTEIEAELAQKALASVELTYSVEAQPTALADM